MSSAEQDRSARERPVEQQLRELRTVNELIRTLTSTLELPEILRIVLDRLKRLTQAEALSLMLYDADRQELVFAATETLRENALVGVHLPPSTSLASWVARSGETVSPTTSSTTRASTRRSTASRSSRRGISSRCRSGAAPGGRRDRGRQPLRGRTFDGATGPA